MINKIVVFGASITSSPWWTWKDFLEMESGLPVVDLSRRGAGNEYMTHSLMDADIDKNTLVVGMLTNVDKFDWYVQGDQFQELQQEKHRPISIDSDSGFWCTGSWFPKKKEIYKKFFYNLDYFCTRTIQQILLIRKICESKGCSKEIFFDSPIWTYTEKQLNLYVSDGIPLEKIDMLDLPLSSKWKNLLDEQERHLDIFSIIGYCMKKDLPWHNAYYRAHPPSSSHWQYYLEIVKPRIEPYVNLSPQSEIISKIQQMDRVWKES